MIELDPLYVDIAIRRQEQTTSIPARHAELGLTFAETAAKRGINHGNSSESRPDMPEFHRTRLVAHDLLAKTAMWWEPGYAKTLHQGEERPLQPIYFRISISEISGHQGIPVA